MKHYQLVKHAYRLYYEFVCSIHIVQKNVSVC